MNKNKPLDQVRSTGVNEMLSPNTKATATVNPPCMSALTASTTTARSAACG